MKTKGNTCLITGGATGIGFSLAEALVSAGNAVIICGRREERLRQAKSRLPQIGTMVCDISKKSERLRLFKWVKDNCHKVNVLVNTPAFKERWT